MIAERKAGRGLKYPTVYQRMIEAAKRGRGLRLTAGDVFDLSGDDAISTCAANDSLAQCEEQGHRRRRGRCRRCGEE